MAFLRQVERAAELLPFAFAAHDMVPGTVRSLAKGACRRLVLDAPHRSNKPIACFGNGLNILVVAWLLIERLTKGRYIPVEIPFFHKAVGPNKLDQLFLGHHVACSLQENEQNSEDCRRDLRAVARFSQEELPGVHAKIIKFVNASLCEHAALWAFSLPK